MIINPVDGDLRVYMRVGVRGGRETRDSSLGRDRGLANPEVRVYHAGFRLSLTLPCNSARGVVEWGQEVA